MAIKKVFKSHIPYINYVTAGGRTCCFREGRYETDHPEEVAEISKQIKLGATPHLWIDEKEAEIDTTLQDKMREAAKAAAMAVLAEHNAAQNGAQTPDKTATGTQGTAQNAGQGTTMSAAKLLGVTSTATLGAGLAAQSNQPSK